MCTLIPRFFRSYLAEYEAIQSAASDDVEKFVGNPLNSYRLIKKMTSDWKEVKEVITSNSGEALVQNLTGLADFKVSERAQCIKILWESIYFCTYCMSWCPLSLQTAMRDSKI